MKKYVLLAAVLTTFGFMFSCTHEPVLPDHQVSYANDIYPIILTGCVHSGCHDTIANETFSLINYQYLMQSGIVNPGNPKSSRMYEAITTASGEDKMPREPYPQLTARQIKLIYIWIAQGAQNN